MSLVHARPPATIPTVRAAKTGGTPVRDGKGDAVPLRYASGMITQTVGRPQERGLQVQFAMWIGQVPSYDYKQVRSNGQ
jgi:hypothetical protein